MITGLPAQTKQFNLTKGNIQLFRGYVYCYGFSAQGKGSALRLYKLHKSLKTLDSAAIDLGKNTPDDYLQVSSDTLHDFLNIYLQKKEKKLVTVLRFNHKFEQVALVENVDIARLNSISAFESELLYAGKCVYTVKSQPDSGGKQFYLNKFTLKSELKNFDYEFTWQFPFERRNVRQAHVFYADRRNVLLYVTVSSGSKAGQWLLNINAVTGKLIRGTRLSEKGDAGTCGFGGFRVDTLNKTILLCGQKLTEAQWKPEENRLSISNAPFADLYLVEIDSMGETISRQDFRIPINDQKSGAKKTSSNYIFRIGAIKKSSDGQLQLETDVFKNSDNSLTYFYVNSTFLTLALNDEGRMALEKNSLSNNALIEKFYVSPDKTDRNGKLALDSLNEFEKLFYKPLLFPIKQQFKTNGENNPVWILKKSNAKKNIIAWSFLAPVKKIYQLTVIEELNTFSNPVMINTAADSFLTGHQPDDTNYQLKLFNW